MTRERPEDVARARAGVRNAGVTYGPRGRRRTVADVWRDFAARYGWRAYALPVLVVLTVAALMTTTQVTKSPSGPAPVDAAHKAVGRDGDGGGGQPVPPVASGSIALKQDDASSSQQVNNEALKAAALPPGPSYTEKGDGTFRVLKGTSAKVGSGQLFRYSIDVENGVKGVDLAQYQEMVVHTLADPRSWSGHGVALQRVDSGRIDFHVSLTSSMSVRNL
ncbi:MAG TPA: DUF3152 domain-containing protein, partial [Jatrophihabitans sp.]|nr:DUF3152 domain-containing protein [Jatrophihabitans sp.]